MKKFSLKQIIKEEVYRALREDDNTFSHYDGSHSDKATIDKKVVPLFNTVLNTWFRKWQTSDNPKGDFLQLVKKLEYGMGKNFEFKPASSRQPERGVFIIDRNSGMHILSLVNAAADPSLKSQVFGSNVIMKGGPNQQWALRYSDKIGGV
jgi:hypothetical protein